MNEVRLGCALAVCLLLGCGGGSTDPGPEPDPSARATKSRKLPFQNDVELIDTAGGKEITEGSLKLRVDAVKIGTIKVRANPGEEFVQRPERYLLIQLTLTNVGQMRKLPYIGWGSFDAKAGGNAARLTDERDRTYKPRDFGQNAAVEGQLRSVNLIQGKPRRDLMVFDVPPRDVKLLQLELPRVNFGEFGGAPIRLRLRLQR